MIHKEVRKKIVAARERGMTIRAIAEAYGYNETSIYRLLRRYREEGSVEPQTHLRGRKPALSAQEMETLRQLIIDRPDITLAEIRETMVLSISLAAICKIVKHKLGFNYKKRQYMPAKGIAPMS